MFERIRSYVEFHPEVLTKVSYMFNLFLVMVIGIMIVNMNYYKNTSVELWAATIHADKLVKQANTKLKVLETHYYELPEDFSIMEAATAKVYSDKFITLKRVEGVIKNKVFINYLSKVKLEDEYVELIAGAFYDASIKYQMDSRELIATAWHESRFRPAAKSIVGATGVMQIMELWLKNDDFAFENEVYCKQDLLNPVKNIQAGAYIYNHYKKYWKRRGYKEDHNVRRLALLSYNRGKGRVSRLLRDGIDPANGYFKVISSKFDKLKKLEEKMI